MEKTKRPWGEYKVVGKTKIIRVNPNSKLSLQYHDKREEFWEILSGKGKIILGEKEIEVKKGDTFIIPKKTKHRVMTEDSTLEFLEIATGEVLEEDIIRLEDIYDREKQKVVCISGYFDPLHTGHLEYISKSKRLGDKLVVILNNNEQTSRKKGNPFMDEKERKIILESLKDVDEVVISMDKDKSVCETLRKINPDIFANGGDRFNYEVPEAKVCEELKIQIVDGLGEKIQSSSWLIKSAKENGN